MIIAACSSHYRCTNPKELHKYIPDDGKCHYYRLISIADALDLAVVTGVISPSDFVIDRAAAKVYMDTQVGSLVIPLRSAVTCTEGSATDHAYMFCSIPISPAHPLAACGSTYL